MEKFQRGFGTKRNSLQRRAAAILFLTSASVLPSASVCGQISTAVQNDIGLTELRAANPGLTEGVGIKAHLVEAFTPAGTDRYVPNPSDGQIANNAINIVGKPATAVDAELYSGHALGSARNFFGTSGVARDLGRGNLPIDAYTAVLPTTTNDNHPSIDWVNGLVGNGGRAPVLAEFDRSTVSSHSYVFTSDENGSLPAFMRRLDHIINETDTSTVVGTNNGGNLPPGWAPSYNAITVGRSNGTHASGLTTTYGSGRVAVDVVAPVSTTSAATPIVAGAVAILQDAADGGDAARSEVIRATILAGATKDAGDIATPWSRTTTQPLDSVYGAGELNIFNSYNIQQGGEVNGSALDPGSAAGFNGWDYESNLAVNEESFYEFVVAAGEELTDFSVALAWNMDIVDNNRSNPFNNSFSPSEELANLSLELFDSTGSFLGSSIDSSLSSVDNVEHIYQASGLTEGVYHLRVSNDNAFATDYGLAWRGTIGPVAVAAVPEPGSIAVVMMASAVVGLRRRKRIL